MKQVSELLRVAQEGAPPARYGVADVIAAGRRRVRRRNTGWAVGAALAVALVIGAPQVLARPDAQQPVLPAAPTSAPAARHSFDFPFRGFTFDRLQVTDPHTNRLDRISAAVNLDGRQVGTLFLYPPGVEIADLYDRRTATEPIDGRPAYLVKGGFGEGTLAWETAGNRIAVLDFAAEGNVSKVHRLATRFALGAGQPARLAFRTGYVPDDYRLVSVRMAPSESHATLLPVAAAEEVLADPSRQGPPEQAEMITIRVTPVGEDPQCATGDGSACETAVHDGCRLEVHSQGARPAEVRKIFESITRVDPTDPSTWFVVDDAFPTSARL